MTEAQTVRNPSDSRGRGVNILLVDDNMADVRLTEEALKRNAITSELNVVMNGEEALAFLYRDGKYVDAPRPDIILLDLNMPKMDGREVLARIKSDDELKRIPVVVLTTSEAEEDIHRAYNLNVNCYITKPVEFDRFVEAIRIVEEFWLKLVKLPSS